VAQAGRALIRAYYGKPQLTYFVGGSKGGQEGMMAVQRFPRVRRRADRLSRLSSGPCLHRAAGRWAGDGAAARALGQIGADGLPLINKAMSDEDILLAQHAILAACDGLDGTQDGMVENFTACTTSRVLPHLNGHRLQGRQSADKTAPACCPCRSSRCTRCSKGRSCDGKAIYSDWPWDAGIGAQTAGV
jgi:feruloyl esterase